MSSLAIEPSLPPVGETAVRAHASELQPFAADHGIPVCGSPRQAGWWVMSPRIVTLFGVAGFELAAVHLLDAEVRLYSDRVLDKRNVSPDLVTARPL